MADEKLTDLSTFEALRSADMLSVERIFREEVGTLHAALVNELIRTFGAAGGMARALIEARDKGKMTEAQAQNISKSFGEIVRGSEMAVAATEKALRGGRSLKARALGWIFNLRTAALAAGAAALVALGFIIQVVPDNWLLGVPSTVWSGVLFAVLGGALIVGLMRYSKIAGSAAVLLIASGIGGYGYLNGWFCQWGFGSECDVPPPPVVYNECDPQNPNYDLEKCLIGSVDEGGQDSSCQDTGTCVSPIPPIKYGGELIGRCKEARERLRNKKRPAQCFDVLFATTRAQEGDGYGRTSAPLTTGVASVLVPYLVPQGQIDQYCIRLTEAQISKASFLEKIGIHLLGLDENPICKKDKNGNFRVKSDFVLKTQKDYFEYRSGLKDGLANSDWVGLGTVDDEKDLQFLTTELEARLLTFPDSAKDARTVLLYAHGFNTDFKASVDTAAHLSSFLNFRDQISASEEFEISTGIPVVFSWPTMTAADGQLSGQPIETVIVNYLESQLRAEVASSEFRRLLSEMASNTSVSKMNVLAHSMGNRLVMRAMSDLQEPLLNKLGEEVEINIVHAAADVGLAEAKRKISTLYAPNNVFIYRSDTDKALSLSTLIQALKVAMVKAANDEDETFADRIPELRVYAKREFGIDDNLFDGLERELQKREGKLLALIAEAKLQVDDFLLDDPCRLGGQSRERMDTCITSLAELDTAEIIDSSNFVPESFLSFGRLVSGGHGYFEGSPPVVADLACALRDIGPETGRRALSRDAEYPNIFVLDAGATDTVECTERVRLYLYELAEEAEIIERTETVYFELMKFDEVYLRPAPYGDPLPPKARSLIRDIAKDVAERPSAKIRINAYADGSGREDYNEDLSMKRASFVERLLKENGVTAEIESYGLGEYPYPRKANARAPADRKAEIEIDE